VAIMALTLPTTFIADLFTETVLFSFYTVLFAVAIHVLFFRRSNKGKANQRLLQVYTVVMYLLSATHLIFNLIEVLEAIKLAETRTLEDAAAAVQSHATVPAQEFINVTNAILADSVLIWRVWIVWGRRYVVVAVPSLLLCGTVVTGYQFAHAFLTQPNGASIFTGGVIKFAPAAAALTLCTNILCTSLIAGRIWYMQRKILKAMGPADRDARRPYTKVLLMVLESGAVISATWLVILAVFPTESNALYIVYDGSAQITGMVPTIIILFTYLNLTIGNSTEETYTTQLRFQNNSRKRAEQASTAIELESRTTRGASSSGATRADPIILDLDMPSEANSQSGIEKRAWDGGSMGDGLSEAV